MYIHVHTYRYEYLHQNWWVQCLTPNSSMRLVASQNLQEPTGYHILYAEACKPSYYTCPIRRFILLHSWVTSSRIHEGVKSIFAFRTLSCGSRLRPQRPTPVQPPHQQNAPTRIHTCSVHQFLRTFKSCTRKSAYTYARMYQTRTHSRTHHTCCKHSMDSQKLQRYSLAPNCCQWASQFRASCPLQRAHAAP